MRLLTFLMTWLLAGLLFSVRAQPTGPTVLVPATGFTNGSALSRAPDPSRRFQRAVIVYPPADVQGLAAGTPLVSLGFEIRTAASAPAGATGTLRLWLVNTTHTNYLLVDDWNTLLTSPAAFQQVYNGPLTIPAGAGWYDMAFTTPFQYAGGGIYLAFEWETTAPASSSGTYACDARLGQSWHGATSSGGFPSQLTDLSAYRPLLRLGTPSLARDAAVVRVYGPGELAQQTAVAPFPVQAVIRNLGTQALTNVPVTFTPAAGAGQAVTVVLPSLAPSTEATVRLPGLLPAAGTTNTSVRYEVRVNANDQNPANDARPDSTWSTLRELSYVTGFPNAATGTNSVGFNTAQASSGSLLCRFPQRAAALVSAVRIRLPSVISLGNTIFGVVLDEQGHLLGRSADVVLDGTLSGAWLTMPLLVPVRTTGRAFFAGLAQTRPISPGQFYYPLATQPELPARDSAYYSVSGDSALTGLKRPREIKTLGRFMVAVTLETAPLAVRPATAPVAALDAWPNPARDEVAIRSSALRDGPVTVRIFTSLNQQVRAVNSLRAVDQQTTVSMAGLPPGLYLLLLADAAGRQFRSRVAVE